MPGDDTEKIGHYLKRAAELRDLAERMRTPEARQLLLNVAEHYDRLAAHLQKLADRQR